MSGMFSSYYQGQDAAHVNTLATVSAFLLSIGIPSDKSLQWYCVSVQLWVCYPADS